MSDLKRATVRPSWDAQILEHLSALQHYALGLARNFHMAEDLVHDTIVKAYTCVEKFQPGTNLRAWLFTILRNTFYSGLRQRKFEVSDPDGLHASRLTTPPDHDGKLAMREFLRAFTQLSHEHRTIVTLVAVSGYSHIAASKLTGVSVGTAKSRLSRARAQLSEALDSSGVAPLNLVAAAKARLA